MNPALRWRLGLAAGVLLALAATASAPAQDPRTRQPLTEADLSALHAAGCSSEELLEILERHGIEGIDPDGVTRLEQAGVPATVTGRLTALLRQEGRLPLTAGDVVALVKSGMAEAEILRRLTASGSRFELSVEVIVDLVRQGVPPNVIKHMREHVKAASAEPKELGLDDLLDMTAAGLPASEILRRIQATDARFEVDVDDLVRLAREDVSRDVLKEVWARRQPRSGEDSPADAAPPSATASAEIPPAAEPASAALLHREPSGGFSVLVPAGWFLHRESLGANTLLSFTDEKLPPSGGLAGAELQVFRYRSSTPERLTETNLEAIASNFLNRLKASFATRRMSFTYGRGERTAISGRPALGHRVSSSAEDGVTQEGEVLVTWDQDQVFVLSYAVRAERFAEVGPLLGTCARSFTLEKPAELPGAQGSLEDQLAQRFELWRKAVKGYDFALYRALTASLEETPADRQAFVALAQRLHAPDIRLSFERAVVGPEGASVEARIISPEGVEALKLAFEVGEGGRLRLKP